MELFDYGIISDGIIDLKLIEKKDENKEKGWSPEYKFEIRLHNDTLRIGHLNIRIGNNEKIIKYIGHIGYGINKEYQGNKFSLRACHLAKKILEDHLIYNAIITCNPENFASRRICELLGGELIEIINVPKEMDIFSDEESRKCRYSWNHRHAPDIM